MVCSAFERSAVAVCSAFERSAVAVCQQLARVGGGASCCGLARTDRRSCAERFARGHAYALSMCAQRSVGGMQRAMWRVSRLAGAPRCAGAGAALEGLCLEVDLVVHDHRAGRPGEGVVAVDEPGAAQAVKAVRAVLPDFSFELIDRPGPVLVGVDQQSEDRCVERVLPLGRGEVQCSCMGRPCLSVSGPGLLVLRRGRLFVRSTACAHARMSGFDACACCQRHAREDRLIFGLLGERGEGYVPARPRGRRACASWGCERPARSLRGRSGACRR
jgi:hypothetical protein